MDIKMSRFILLSGTTFYLERNREFERELFTIYFNFKVVSRMKRGAHEITATLERYIMFIYVLR